MAKKANHFTEKLVDARWQKRFKNTYKLFHMQWMTKVLLNAETKQNHLNFSRSFYNYT